MFIITLILVTVSVVKSENGSLAPFITKCKFDDTKCILETSQAAIQIFAAGVPEFGVETLDPLQIKRIDASSSGLKLYLNDITIIGLKDCIAKKMQRDVSKKYIELLCNVDMSGLYEINGQLFDLPVEGKGKIHVMFRNMLISVDVDVGEIVGKDGAKHFIIKDWTHSYSLQDKATLEFDNMFDGNEDLVAVIREVISKRSNETITKISSPIINAVTKKIVENMRKFFFIVPIDDLYL